MYLLIQLLISRHIISPFLPQQYSPIDLVQHLFILKQVDIPSHRPSETRQLGDRESAPCALFYSRPLPSLLPHLSWGCPAVEGYEENICLVAYEASPARPSREVRPVRRRSQRSQHPGEVTTSRDESGPEVAVAEDHCHRCPHPVSILLPFSQGCGLLPRRCVTLLTALSTVNIEHSCSTLHAPRFALHPSLGSIVVTDTATY